MVVIKPLFASSLNLGSGYIEITDGAGKWSGVVFVNLALVARSWVKMALQAYIQLHQPLAGAFQLLLTRCSSSLHTFCGIVAFDLALKHPCARCLWVPPF